MVLTAVALRDGMPEGDAAIVVLNDCTTDFVTVEAIDFETEALLDGDTLPVIDTEELIEKVVVPRAASKARWPTDRRV